MFELRSQRGTSWRRVQLIMASNPAIASLLQSTRLVGRVAELGSLGCFAMPAHSFQKNCATFGSSAYSSWHRFGHAMIVIPLQIPALGCSTSGFSSHWKHPNKGIEQTLAGVCGESRIVWFVISVWALLIARR